MTYRLQTGMVCMLAALALLMGSCAGRGGKSTEERQDPEAKRLLQGAWLTADGGEAAFMVRGDSLFYADNTSLPARVWVCGDSLYVQSATVRAYHISKQAEHLLKFDNVYGEEMKLVKADDGASTAAFTQARPYAMNLTRVEDEDTLAALDGADGTSVSIHTEPASDRMAKSVFNDLGMEVDNMYLDNVSTVSLRSAAGEYFRHDFRKAEFAALVPRDFMSTAILRGVEYAGRDARAVYLSASIGVPDAETCYVAEIKVTPDGRYTTRLK